MTEPTDEACALLSSIFRSIDALGDVKESFHGAVKEAIRDLAAVVEERDSLAELLTECNDREKALEAQLETAVPFSADDAARLYLRQLRKTRPSPAVLVIVEQLEQELRERAPREVDAE